MRKFFWPAGKQLQRKTNGVSESVCKNRSSHRSNEGVTRSIIYTGLTPQGDVSKGLGGLHQTTEGVTLQHSKWV